jgi:hypothetical protein
MTFAVRGYSRNRQAPGRLPRRGGHVVNRRSERAAPASNSSVGPVLDLVELVDRKVADELARLNGELEALVAQAVDRELDRLVRDLVKANLEGRGNGRSSVTESHRDIPMTEATPPAASMTCRRCGETKPVEAFHSGKRLCKVCRRAEDRAREARRRQQDSSSEAARLPFRWHDVDALARGFPRTVVRNLIREELRAGRLESDGNGRVRLCAGALESEVVGALAAIVR